MPLDIHLDADIAGLREFAGSFRKLAKHAHEIGTDVRAAGSNSTQDWGGKSGPAFRSAMGDFGGSADKVHGGADKLAGGVDHFTDQMNHVKTRLQQARQVASGAGLRTTDKQIFEPGPGPGAPKPLPKNATPQQTQAHTAASQAHAAHQAQQKAYHECTQTVADARKCQQQANTYLQDLVGSDGVHKGINATNAIAGLMGSATGASRALRSKANGLYSKAAAELKIANAARAGGDSAGWARAIQRRSMFLTQANARTRDATSTVFRRMGSMLPQWAQRTLGPVVPKEAQALSKFGKAAFPVLKRVPIVGVVATAAGATFDIADGVNPVKAIGSGVGSLAAGTVAGEVVSGGLASAATGVAAGTTIGETAGVIAGPAGVVVGAAVGAGVGYAVDHWDDITNWAGHQWSNVGNALANIF